MINEIDTLVEAIVTDFSKFVKGDEERINTFKND